MAVKSVDKIIEGALAEDEGEDMDAYFKELHDSGAMIDGISGVKTYLDRFTKSIIAKTSRVYPALLASRKVDSNNAYAIAKLIMWDYARNELDPKLYDPIHKKWYRAVQRELANTAEPGSRNPWSRG